MLEQVVTIFDGLTKKVKKLKKASYEENMKAFRKEHGHYIDENNHQEEGKEDKKAAAREVSLDLINQIKEHFSVRGKIRGVVQMDLNLFMIYYVFPSILLTYHDDAKLLADTLCEVWNEQFPKEKIGYTDYNTLYKSFNEKILGIFG